MTRKKSNCIILNVYLMLYDLKFKNNEEKKPNGIIIVWIVCKSIKECFAFQFMNYGLPFSIRCSIKLKMLSIKFLQKLLLFQLLNFEAWGSVKTFLFWLEFHIRINEMVIVFNTRIIKVIDHDGIVILTKMLTKLICWCRGIKIK